VILVISHPQDGHTKAILEALTSLGSTAHLLDLSGFPKQYRLEARYDGDRARTYRLRQATGNIVDLGTCGASWWRRPQAFVLHEEIRDPTNNTFAYTEATEAFTGLWQAMDCYWVNNPAADANAHRKLYQLRVAQDVGLTIPETLITSDPALAREFVARLGVGRTIYKAFSGTREAWRETRLVKEDEVPLMEAVRFAPVIFQRYIEAKVDLRVTVVGNEIFSAALYSQQSTYPIDFRMDMAHTRIEVHTLPLAVQDQLRALMQRLGIVYGAIDMRLTPEGEYVFLEVNPAGQWLFIEGCSRQPITAALACLLHDRDRARG
jgi:Glutathione synthase/Ribosomal protein S6 modification enzyme (glutaminyl transferase)